MTTPLDAVRWIHGAPDCARSTDPLIQVHPFDDNSFILRLSKCYSFEGNFMYLLLAEATSQPRQFAVTIAVRVSD